MKLSDRNNKIQTTARPQSPQVAGMQVTLPPGSQIPSGWVELNGQTLTGAETAYPDLWAASPAAWKSGSDLVLPNGPLEYLWVDLDVTGTNWTTGTAIGKITNSGGVYALDFQIQGTTSSTVGNVVVNVAGVNIVAAQAGTGWSQQQGVADRLTLFVRESAGGLQIASSGSSSDNWSMSGKVLLAGKPTDAFVGADADFSTFDEALEGTPCIKLYSDTTSAVSVGINEATATEPGVVKANRVQTKILPSDFNATGSTATIASLNFNSLIIGKRYLVRYKFNITFGNNSAVINIAVNNGASQVADLRQASNNNVVSSRFGEIEFTASSSTVSVLVNNAGTVNSIIRGNNTTRATYAEIEELNNTIETTDFT